MAVSIYYNKMFWGAGNSLGYLIINTTADFITDPNLKKHLQEIDKHNLGALSLDDLNKHDKNLIRNAILQKTIPKIKKDILSDEVHNSLDDLAKNLSVE
jgi:hypothetical protein